MIESAVDGIVVIDARGRIEAFNPAAERLFGYRAAELIGRNVSVLMPSPDREQHDNYLARYLREGHPRIIGIGREVTGRRADGTTFPLHLAVGEMVLGGERTFTGILRDLTARVALEKRLSDQAALAQLGEMAAVIAHEVKNPLAGIRGVVQVIGSRLPGIAPEIRDKIFTPFVTTKARGSGLGLVTSRRFIEAHGGSLVVDCPVGGGTVATVTLPLA